MDVSIIIVNYNTTKYLRSCLNSIFDFTKGINYEIIVVDNNSPDREIESFNTIYPSVRLFLREINDGFGAGCNFGAKLSNGKYLFFINPDIILKGDIIKSFISLMEKSNNIHACTCLFENEEGELIYSYNNFPDIKSEIGEAFWFGFKKKQKKLLEKPEILENKIFDIDYSLGALIFIKKECFESISGFDERFFLYGEDIDFGYSLKKKNYKFVCVPYLKVYHYYGSSVDSIQGKYIESYHLNRSKMIYAYKHYSFIQRTITRIIMLIGISLRIVYLPFNKIHKGERKNNFKRIFKSMNVFFMGYNKIIEKIV